MQNQFYATPQWFLLIIYVKIRTLNSQVSYYNCDFAKSSHHCQFFVEGRHSGYDCLLTIESWQEIWIWWSRNITVLSLLCFDSFLYRSVWRKTLILQDFSNFKKAGKKCRVWNWLHYWLPLSKEFQGRHVWKNAKNKGNSRNIQPICFSLSILSWDCFRQQKWWNILFGINLV